MVPNVPTQLAEKPHCGKSENARRNSECQDTNTIRLGHLLELLNFSLLGKHFVAFVAQFLGFALFQEFEREFKVATVAFSPLGLGIFLVTTFATFLFYDYLVDHLGIAALTAVLMVGTAFLFVAVATYIAGLVGSSNSPVSGMTICALLIAAGVMLALGIRGESAILATLGIAGVVCCATCHSGDVAQDLKTGLLVGATPAKQQWTEVLGAIIPAFFFAPTLSLLHQTYGIGTGAPGSLRAPQAALFVSLTEGFFGDGSLPWNMIGIGAGVGVALIITNILLERSESTFRTHVMPVAVGS